jgi:uncharacterized protein (DUF2345 family)
MIKILGLAALIGLQATIPVSAMTSHGTVSEPLTFATATAQAQPCDHASERRLPGALQTLQQEGTTNQGETEYRRGPSSMNTDCALV